MIYEPTPSVGEELPNSFRRVDALGVLRGATVAIEYRARRRDILIHDVQDSTGRATTVWRACRAFLEATLTDNQLRWADQSAESQLTSYRVAIIRL